MYRLLSNLSFPKRMALAVALAVLGLFAVSAIGIYGLETAASIARQAGAQEVLLQQVDFYRWALIGAAAGGAMLFALGGYIQSRGFTRPFEVAVGHIGAIAKGDLTTRIKASGRDEFAWLMWEMSVMQGNLVKLVRDVRESARDIEGVSAEILGDNENLAQRTDQQAASLEQTVSAMGEMMQSVSSNAEGAGEASAMATKTAQVAARGGDLMSGVVQKMSEISDSSRRIGEIVGVIDSIAFQTNILALNAAVEAARAGEQGRGFSVVASEVRALALRSAEAAREIKSLITQSTANVESGRSQVDLAGETMKEIMDSVSRVSQFVNDIATASSEQSNGIREVGQAIDQLDRNTKQNVDLVASTAGASDRLRQRSETLSSSVSSFQLKD